MTPTPGVTPAVTPSFCANVYEQGAGSVDWLGRQAKTLSASAGETLGRVWESVSTFFSSIALTIGQWTNTAKEGLLAARDQIVALPKETKIVGGIALVATAAVAWIASSLWNKAPAAPAVTAPAAAVAAPVAAVAAPVAAAAAAAPVAAAGAPAAAAPVAPAAGAPAAV